MTQDPTNAQVCAPNMALPAANIIAIGKSGNLFMPTFLTAFGGLV